MSFNTPPPKAKKVDAGSSPKKSSLNAWKVPCPILKPVPLGSSSSSSIPATPKRGLRFATIPDSQIPDTQYQNLDDDLANGVNVSLCNDCGLLDIAVQDMCSCGYTPFNAEDDIDESECAECGEAKCDC